MNKLFTLQFCTFCFFLLIAQVGLIAQIPNGGFEDGTEGWEQATPRGAEFNFDIATSDSPEGGQHAVLNVTSQGTNSTNQALSAGIRTAFNVPVTGGTYKLSYRIKSATPDKNIRARLFVNDGGDGGQGTITGETHIALAEWTLFEQNFVLPELTSTGNPTMFVRVLIGVGGTLGDISIDDIVIAPTEVSPPADNDGDGFTDDVDCDDTNAAINPNAIEVDDNEVDENCDGILGMTIVDPVDPNVLNLGFEEGMVNWDQFTPRGAEFNFDIATSDSPEGGQHAVLNVTSQGTNSQNQALAAGIRTAFNVPVTGGTYKLSYRIKSATPDKNIRARLFINDGGDGGQGTITGETHIAPAGWTLFEQNFVLPELTDTGNPTKFVRILLGVGGTLGDISIDDIVIAPTEVSPPADNDGDGFTDDVDCDDTNAAINPNAVEVDDNEVDENCDGVLGMTEVDPVDPVDPNVLNLGFEEGMVNWEQATPRGAEFNFDIATSDSPEGGQHAVLNVTSLGTNTPNQARSVGIRTAFNVPVTGGTYKLSYRIKSATPDKNFRARLFINDGGDGGQGTITGEVHIAPAEWTLFEQDIVIPELTSTGNPTKFARILLGVGGTLGDISIDDIVIAPTEVSPPADNDGDGFTDDVDCDDTNAAINPGASEIANSGFDENCDGVSLIIDNDNDGYNSSIDCDDNNAAINPSASEIANSGFDENCDGVSLIIDNDNDGFNSSIDCDDNNAAINPNAIEVDDNEVDENCDGVLGKTPDPVDSDGDGFTADVDCDDTNAAINPNAVEVDDNEVDENCDGVLGVTSPPVDNDGDGFAADVDCDDANAAINPNAVEVDDNEVDENCDGVLGVTPPPADNDGDGFAADVDCDDTNAAINPNAAEVNDNEVDENCDGVLGMTVVDPNILNLGFEEGMINWEQATPRGAEFNFDIATSDSPEGGQHAVLNVTSLGTNTPNQARSVGIRTAFNVPVTGGTYKLSYRIKSATPDKNFRARLFINDGGDGGQGTITGEVHIAPAEWTLFEQNVVIPELTDTGNPTMFVRILLGVGGTLGDISIDDIVIAPTEVSPPADNDGDGFTADVDCDDTNAAINPNAVEVDDNEVDENCDGVLGMTEVDPNILNLGFEEGMVNWEQATPREAELTFDIATSDSPEGGQHAVLNVTSQGTNTPNQARSVGIRTAFNVPVTGGTYKLSYRIKSATPDKSIRARLFINDGGDGGQGTITGEVQIAPAEWTLFEQNFVIPELTDTGNPTKFARILLGVGGTLGDISIDDIVIAPVDPVSSIFGPSIETFNLNVYPTLVSTQQALTVDLTNFNNDQIDFAIYNTTGQLIKMQTVTGGMPTAIAIEQLPSGSYILQGRHETYQLIGKFIVIK